MIEHRLGPARLVFTDRHGGTSEGAYASANLGDHVGDAPERVAANRDALAARLGVGPHERWQWLRQVHGARVVDALMVDAGDAPGASEPPEADAAVTREAGVPLVVLTADCAPIALVSDDAVAVVHAGWPGLLAGVVEAAAGRLRARGTGEVRAALGPCIHPERYEFGADDLAPLVARLGPDVASTTADGRPALDIPAAVRAALARAGVAHLDDAGVCTAASPDHFSYRRDGPTGRQALVAVLDP